MDLTGLGEVFVNLWKAMRADQELQAWLRLLVSLLITGVISFSGMCGMWLMAGKGWAMSIGIGLFSLAAGWFSVCSVSPQGRYLISAMPKGFITQMQEHPDEVVIQGTKAQLK